MFNRAPNSPESDGWLSAGRRGKTMELMRLIGECCPKCVKCQKSEVVFNGYLMSDIFYQK